MLSENQITEFLNSLYLKNDEVNQSDNLNVEMAVA